MSIFYYFTCNHIEGISVIILRHYSRLMTTNYTDFSSTNIKNNENEIYNKRYEPREKL